MPPYSWISQSKVTRPKKNPGAGVPTKSFSAGAAPTVSAAVEALTKEEREKYGIMVGEQLKSVSLKRARTTFSNDQIRALYEEFERGE